MTTSALLFWYAVLAVICGLYLFFDARRREASAVSWALAGVLATILVLPFWWGVRPLQEGEVRKGGAAYVVLKTYGHLFLIAGFVTFLVMMFSGVDPGTDKTEAEEVARFLGSSVAGVFGAVLWGGVAGLCYAVGAFVKGDKVEQGIP